jgi:hypothetical protein
MKPQTVSNGKALISRPRIPLHPIKLRRDLLYRTAFVDAMENEGFPVVTLLSFSKLLDRLTVGFVLSD